MSTLTKAKVREIIADINAALKPVAEKHGLESLACRRAGYNEANFHVRVEGVVRGGASKEAQRYQLCARDFGLPPLGFSFDMHGRTYQTIGLNSTATKVLCSASDGKKYLFPTHFIAVLSRKSEAGEKP